MQGADFVNIPSPAPFTTTTILPQFAAPPVPKKIGCHCQKGWGPLLYIVQLSFLTNTDELKITEFSSRQVSKTLLKFIYNQ